MRIPSKDFISACDTEAAIGTTWNLNHTDCTAGEDTRKRLYVTRKSVGAFVAYCHNCSGWGVVRAKLSRGSWTKYIPRNTASHVVIPESEFEQPPLDRTTAVSHWSVDAINWATKVGILDVGVFATPQYAPFYSFSPSMDRLIIELGDPVTFWQGRDCTGNSALKYYTGVHSSNPLNPIAFAPENKTLFITEDITSAVRIAGAGSTAIPLCGTSCHNMAHLVAMCNRYDSVYVWLDDDVAGQKASRKLVNSLRLGCIPHVSSCSGYNEPKNMSHADLRAAIHGR